MTPATRAEIETMIARETRILAPPLTPELRFWGADSETPIWTATEETLEKIGLPPPFWAFAWPGGQALARLLIDQPERARAKRVLALAAGGALEAIAAAQSGAARVVANDVDPIALVAARMNAALNRVELETEGSDLLDASPAAEAALAESDLVLVGDAFYETPLTRRLIQTLDRAFALGREILIGDAGRGGAAAAPLLGACDEAARYAVATDAALEGAPSREARVLRLVEPPLGG